MENLVSCAIGFSIVKVIEFEVVLGYNFKPDNSDLSTDRFFSLMNFTVKPPLSLIGNGKSAPSVVIELGDEIPLTVEKYRLSLLSRLIFGVVIIASPIGSP